jgi:hypothetical protein
MVTEAKTYARIQDGRAVELIVEAGDIGSKFHPDLLWLDVSDVAGIEVGWALNGDHRSKPEQVGSDSHRAALTSSG